MSKGSFVLAVAASLLVSDTCLAGEHLVARERVEARLAAAAATREADLAAVRRLLSTPQAASAAAAFGADVGDLRAGAASLGDRELRNLAARAADLKGDPAAGDIHIDTNEFLIIFLIVAIVLVVLKAVD